MVIKSPYSSIDIPKTNILTYLFGDGENLPETPLWIDAVNEKKSLSALKALQWIKRLALGLDAAGMKAGEVLMVVSPNHIFVPIAYLGIVGSGRIFSGANPSFTANELSYQIKDTGARTILIHPSVLSTALAAAAKASLPLSSLFLFSDTPTCHPSIRDWGFLLSPVSSTLSYTWPPLTGEASNTTIACLNYSSGTTGLPKGVMLAHYNLVSNVAQSYHLGTLQPPSEPPPAQRWLGVLPMYHAAGAMVSILLASKFAATVYLMQNFDFEVFLRTIQTQRITNLQLAPPIVVLLQKDPRVKKHDLSSVTALSCGAAPLSGELQNEVSGRFKAPIGQAWGMTELTCTGMSVPSGTFDDTGSVGAPMPNCEVKLVDEDGKEVALGDRGEIYFRGPTVCCGYWKNEKATRETITEDGWLKTGDIAIADEKGWFWIVDRLKELIKVSALQVAPAELEALLLTHDAIADAAVIGLATSFSDQELIRAYVVLKPSEQSQSVATSANHSQSPERRVSNEEDAEARHVSEISIVSWVQQRVAKHKRLTGGVRFVPQIPKSPSGKILRKVVREWARDEHQVEGKLRAKL